jgi:hypothetical protein
MGLNHSPSIVTNGLVCAFDMLNTKKSWKGAPTTNLVSNFNLGPIYSNVSTFDNSYSLTAPDGSTGWSSILNAGCTNPHLAYFPYTSLTNGITYTASIELFNPISPGLTIGVDGTNGITYSNIPQGYSKYKYTFNPPVNGVYNIFFCSYDFISNAVYSPARLIYFKNPQIEQQLVATPFVNGTRSNTQSLIDLTGNNIITANSITPNDDGSFSFNGTSDYLTLGSNLVPGLGDFTVSVWFNKSEIAANKYIWDFGSNGGTLCGPTPLRYYNPTVDTGSLLYTNGPVININTWYNIVVSRIAGITSLYSNGILIGSEPDAGNIGTWGSLLTIGNYGGGGNYFYQGQISNFMVYKGVGLTAAQVQQNFNALRGRYNI